MKKYTSAQLIRLLAAPAATLIPGLVLLLSPDTASALVGRLLGWCALFAAVGFGAGALAGAPGSRNNRIIWAVACFAGGMWLLRNPLSVVEFLGRVLGITLMIRGGKATVDNIRYQGEKPVLSRGLVSGTVTALIGMVLTVLPIAGSRLFFKFLGLLLTGLSVAQLWDNLRGRKLLEKSDDPNIIDVEKL